MATTSFTAQSSRTTTARAVGTFAPDAPLGPLEIERRALGPKDVRIDIKFCGICHSDIHFARGEWGEIPYPAVPGHEIAGVVAEVGSDVTELRARRPRRCRLHGQLVPRVRELPGRQRAVLPRAATRRPTARSTVTAPITYGGYSDHVVVDAGLRRDASRTVSSSMPRRRCCAPGSRPTRRCATGTPAPASTSGSSASAVSATWR